MDLDGVAEPLPVLRCVQPGRRGGDNFHWQRLEADTVRRAYTLQTPAHHSQGVFGGKQEHGVCVGPVPDASPNAPRIDPGASECHPGKVGPAAFWTSKVANDWLI